MKKYLVISTVLLFFLPSLVYSDLISFRVGYFIPNASSDLWTDEFDQMSFQKSDFQASSFSFSYEYFITRQLGLVIAVDGYSKQKAGIYDIYIGENVGGQDYAFDYGEGFSISHVFSVSNTPIQISLKLTPLGRTGKFIPYLGGGVGLYVWSVRLQGDMIDFSQPEIFYDPGLDEDVIGYPIFMTNARDDSRFAIGYQVYGGFMVPIANRISIDGQFKYGYGKGKMDAFAGFEDFDLSGYQISVGINYWF